MQKWCLGIFHIKIAYIYFTVSETSVFLLIFMKIHGICSVDMEKKSDHIKHVILLLGFN